MRRALDNGEAVLYGKFVNSVYAMFVQNERNLTPPLPPAGDPDALPAGWEMTAWIQMSDFAFFGRRKKFYGIAAREIDNPYSHVLVIRGSEGLIEWYDDAICWPRSFTPVPEAGRVSSGFDDIYMTMRLVPVKAPAASGAPTAAEPAAPLSARTFADQVEQLLDVVPIPEPPLKPAGTEHDFVVTGHSLGGALATLYTIEHAFKKRADPARKVRINTACTFASPRVGMRAFVKEFDALPIDSWRIANRQDLVPSLPPSIAFVLPYRHVDKLYGFSSAGVVKCKPKCWHSMRTYLHWLDRAEALDGNCQLRRRRTG
jgi:triacylglycerol lipase